MKITKTMSTRLFKYIKTIDIKFNPFDSRTRSARELMRQVEAARLKKSNPKLKINTTVVGTVDPPHVGFEFIDGTKKEFDSQNFQVDEILNDVYIIANNLDIHYELDGKSIEAL